MKKKAMSEDTLKSVLAKSISESESLTDGKLAKEREEVDLYYRGERPLPMHKGDSKYVSRDVFKAVDSMRATVLEAFSASQRVVFFRPEMGETADDAKQATEYVRHVFFKENDGEDKMYEALTEGLMKRFVVAKVHHEETSDEVEYEFDGLTMEELTAQVSEYPNYEFKDTATSEQGLLSGTYAVTTKKQRCVVDICQPEDILIAANTAELKDAKYIIHRFSKTSGSLLALGFDPKKVAKITFGQSDWSSDYEKQRRHDAVGSVFNSDDNFDEAGQECSVHEIYIKLDREGTGRPKLWKFTYVQGTILDEEVIKRMPFASFVPIPTPHTFHGENFAKSVIPMQNARTVLIRQIINHTLITNNPRLMITNGALMDPSELLDNRIGGLVNVRRPDGINPLPQAAMNPFAFNLINMINDDEEEVTGISRLSQGLSKDAVSSQNSQGMVEQLINAGQQRTKIVARRFGKFMKDLWLLIYDVASDYVTEADYVSVTGSYVEVNPTQWKERKAASVELSLGYGEQEMEYQKWTEIDMRFSQDPMLAPGYSYEKRYEVLTRAMEKRGIEDLQSILTPPDEMQPPEPSEAEVLQMEQAKAQLAYLNAQAQSMIMKGESDRIKAQAELLRAQTDAKFRQDSISNETRDLERQEYIGMEELRLAEKAETQSANYSPDA
jgi:hypothetical protein